MSTVEEIEEGRRALARRQGHGAGPEKNGAANIDPLFHDPTLGAGNEPTDTGLAEVAEQLRAKAATKRQQREQSGANVGPAKPSEQQPGSNDDGADEVCHCEVCAGGEKSNAREGRRIA
jgi:hypothetical protein